MSYIRRNETVHRETGNQFPQIIPCFSLLFNGYTEKAHVTTTEENRAYGAARQDIGELSRYVLDSDDKRAHKWQNFKGLEKGKEREKDRCYLTTTTKKKP